MKTQVSSRKVAYVISYVYCCVNLIILQTYLSLNNSIDDHANKLPVFINCSYGRAIAERAGRVVLQFYATGFRSFQQIDRVVQWLVEEEKPVDKTI